MMITSNSTHFDYIAEYFPELLGYGSDIEPAPAPRKPMNRRKIRRTVLVAVQVIVAAMTTGSLFYLAFPGVLA
jgi:hypothetical protein